MAKSKKTVATTETVKNTWINRVSEKLIHEQTSSTGKAFKSISIPMADGYGSIAVNEGQVFAAKNRTTGEVVDGYYNVLLGAPEKERNISVPNGKGFKSQKMTNKEIADLVDADRKAYKAAQKAVAVAE